MKKLVIGCLILSLLAPGLQARKKTEKAGEVAGNVYTDSRFGFTLRLDDRWKFRIMPNKDNFRLILTQKNYDIPPDYLQAQEYTKVPRVVVYADTSSLSPLAFLDSLLSPTFTSLQKKEILKEFEILNQQTGEEGTERDKTVTRNRRPIVVANRTAAFWEGQADYRKSITTSVSSAGGTRVYGKYGGAVVVANHDKTIVVFHVMCEYDFFTSIVDETVKTISTLTWETSDTSGQSSQTE
ncbi:MAG TPA: hypothetical protein VN285_08420 [Candidatus Deferrimicrobium sp.]|nr:hypothetical protein [Candidatus Deferrimicrobium sp.]